MAAPLVNLYLIPGSSSLFPHILLRKAKIAFTPHPVRISQLTSEKYMAISPKGQVPVLQINDNNGKSSMTVTENPAIAQAINQLAPEQKLFGSTPADFIRVCEWLSWIAGPLHAQAWGAYIRPFRFTADDSEQALAAVKENARQKVLDRFATVDSMLDETGPWALGSQFTAVDAYVFPFYRLGEKLVDVDMAKTYPRWARLMANMLELDSVKETIAYETQARAEIDSKK